MFFRLKFFFLAVSALFLSVFFFARAENPFASIIFPIPELGSCGSFAECKIYCDDLSHVDACVVYGKVHGLIKSEDAQRLKRLPKVGPGGCTSEEACKSYCADAPHINECVAFAEKNNLISGEEASRIRQFAKEGGPGGCKGEDECKNYCNNPSHVDECVSFAEKNGFISVKEAERIRALANKTGPGGCKREECRQYCNDSTHAEECIAFGEKNGFLSHEDALRAKKIIGKIGPGGCQGEQCREYCSDPAHQKECLKFAEENGFIKHDEAERAKKFMDVARESGPGGCQGEQCREYCGAPEHHDECFRFAKDHDLITHEDEQLFEAGQKINDAVKENGGPGGCKNDASCRQYCSDPAHVEECLAFATAHGSVSPEQAEKMLKDFIRGAQQRQQLPQIPGELEDFGEGKFDAHGDFQKFEQEHLDQFRQFEDLEKKFLGPRGFSSGKEQEGFDGRGAQGLQTDNFTGPGGCQGPQECITYCSNPSHREECAKFFAERKMAPPPGALFKQVPIDSESGYRNSQLPPNFTGPGGCKNYEECKAYCSDPNHQSECQTIKPVSPMRVQLMPSAGSANPYPCNSYDSCKAYCADTSHQQEGVCLNLRREQPLPSVLPSDSMALPPSYSSTPLPSPTGTTAYPCNSYDSCKSYCSDASHQQENVCVKFLQLPPQSRSEYFWGGFASLGKAALDLFW